MESRKPLKVVDANLRKASASNPDKNIADVILDGTYTKHDIYSILNSAAFPTNAMGTVSPDEENYDSGQAIEAFARTITPFLSDVELHRLTSLVVEVECTNDTSAFRNASLAKALLKIQVERLPANEDKSELLDAIKCHLREHILDVIKKYWGGNLQANINKFLSFNLGYPEVKGDTYQQQITAFDVMQFNREINKRLPGGAPDADGRESFIRAYSKNPKMHLPPVADVNYHPWLLNPSAAKAHAELIYSDHLPIIAEMLINNEVIKVISWNLWDPNQANGFKTPNEPVTAESLGDQTARFERVTDSVIRMLTNADNNMRADVMLLQEVHPECLAMLQRKLKDTPFAIVTSETGKVTIYSQEKMKLESQKEYFRECSLNTVFQVGDSKLCIDNMQLNYDALPVYAEDTLQKLMKARSSDIRNHLIMGDFNARIKPIDREDRLIITGVCPSTFRRDNQGREICQGVDWTDGAFRATRDNTLTQVEHRVINPATCEVMKSIPCPFLPELNDNQRNELAESRMAVCVGSPYNDERIFDNRTKTIIEFQTALRSTLNDDSVLVRIGSNALNQDSICIATQDAKFINDLFSCLPGTRAMVKAVETDQTVYVLSVGRQWLTNLECALFASQNLVKDKLINACNSIKGKLPKSGIFSKHPDTKLAENIVKILNKVQTPGAENLMMAAIMASRNENLKEAISREFGITKMRDIETAFTMMLKSPFNEEHKDAIVHAINIYNADYIQKKLENMEKEFEKGSKLERTV